MEIDLVTGLDLPAGENVWAVTTGAGTFHHRSKLVHMGDDTQKDHAAIQTTIKITVWCCDETGEAIHDTAGQPKAMVSKTRALMKEKIGTGEIVPEEEAADLITELLQRSRANCVTYDGFLSSLPTE